MNKKELCNLIRSVMYRDCIILSNPKQHAKPGTVNLHWWELEGKTQNIGDFLSPVIVQYMKSMMVCDHLQTHKTTHLYAVGSIIDGGYQNATVWGSGLLRGKESYWWSKFRKLDIRAVRGPLTRKALIDNGYDCPEVYGDPAILMPLIYQPQEMVKKYQYRVVPHMIYGINYPNALSPMVEDWRLFIDEIVQSERIISSSLHGIILAEAYGVPAILLAHDMNIFKYKDYYFSTGRYEFPVAQTVEEALCMSPAPLPDLRSMQKKLMEVFPKDIWAEK